MFDTCVEEVVNTTWEGRAVTGGAKPKSKPNDVDVVPVPLSE